MSYMPLANLKFILKLPFFWEVVRDIPPSITQSGFASLRVRVRAPVDSSRPFVYILADRNSLAHIVK